MSKGRGGRARGLVGLLAFALTVLLGVQAAGAAPGFAPVQLLPIPSGATAETTNYLSISCSDSAACAATGVTSSGDPFVATESSGTWGVPQAIPLPTGGTDGSLAVSCPSAGSCLGAGSYKSSAAVLPLIVQESAGTWGSATTLTPPSDALTGASERAALTRPWCASMGNCQVVGLYQASNTWELMTATETAGVWGPSTAFGGALSALPQIDDRGRLIGLAFTCTVLGDCVLVSDTATWAETQGSWSTATPLPIVQGPDPPEFWVADVACASTSTCIAVGLLWYDSCPCRPGWAAASAIDSNGSWAAPENDGIGGVSQFDGISCVAAQCVAVGNMGSDVDEDPYLFPLAVTWSAKTSWSTPSTEPTPTAPLASTEASWLDSVSCGTSTQCVAVGRAGDYGPNGGPENLVPYDTAISPVSAAVAPGVPRSLVATPALGGATVSWSAPQSDGGSPISTYTVTVAQPWGYFPVSCTTSTTSCTLAGLTNGKQYVVLVTANNGTASSAPAFSNHFFAGQVPSTPSDVGATALLGGAESVTWAPSSAPAGEPVLRYEVRLSDGVHQYGFGCIARPSARACTLHYLVPGRSYRVAVTALDVTGRSAAAVLSFVAA